MMLPMHRAFLLAAAAALLASCGSVTPSSGGGIASASAQNPEEQAAELAAKGIAGEPPKVKIEQKDNRKYEIHTVTVDPRRSQGTFVLCRYFMAMDEWILQAMTENSNGTRTYVFRRLVQGPNIEVDPLKPQPVNKKSK